MRRTLIYCHPYDKSYNAAIKSVIVDVHRKSDVQLKVFDLYERQFNPVMSQKELREFARARTKEGINIENLDPMAVEMARAINESDELILLFPIWWGLMPAQMKGFIDKVIFPGLIYTQVSEFKLKLISDTLKKVTVITTMNAPSFLYRVVFGNSINFALKYGTFKKIGVKSYSWMNLSSVKLKSQSKRQEDLRRIEKVFGSMRYRKPTLAPTSS
ncbi:MAG: NAD(P)H-dependent oxidoreductase [Anaerolineales bacterium]